MSEIQVVKGSMQNAPTQMHNCNTTIQQIANSFTSNLHVRSMVLLELAKGLLLVRDLGGKGVLESGDGADDSSSSLGGEEGLNNAEGAKEK